jgi:hypothetical protein
VADLLHGAGQKSGEAWGKPHHTRQHQKIALRIGVSDFPANLGRKEKPSESRMPNGSFTIHTYEYRNGMNCFCTPETED